MKEKQRNLEIEWARYKYWVMSRSQETYLLLRKLFSESQFVSEHEFFDHIDAIKDLPENPKAEMNAFQHVWGYLKHKVSETEKDKALSYLEEYRLKERDRVSVYDYLYELSKKYEIQYLLDSYYFH